MSDDDNSPVKGFQASSLEYNLHLQRQQAQPDRPDRLPHHQPHHQVHHNPHPYQPRHTSQHQRMQSDSEDEEEGTNPFHQQEAHSTPKKATAESDKPAAKEDEEIFPRQVVIQLHSSLASTLMFILIASCIEMLAAISSCAMNKNGCANYGRFAIAVGLVSSVMTATMMFMHVYAKDLAAQVCPMVSLVLVVWWMVGATITTFLGPFNEIQNGFFSSWFALMCTVNLTYHSVTSVQDLFRGLRERTKTTPLQTRLFLAIAIGSGVELIASSVLCSTQKDCSGSVKLGILSGVLSLIVCVCSVTIDRYLPPILSPKNVSFVLAVWWTVSASILTFGETFRNTGNGYFSSWFCCLVSVHLSYVEIFGD
eukprot:c8258_g1_i2.p2 GENE.c8258_g1_i2~~c8258_g1_i2.p2  ORF type:complete len:366 (-),score=60.47 c8258_g1_i2:1252-2349(-)